MIFYCFPRIIGRVHREGKVIHQSAAEGNRERRGDREREGERDEGRESACVRLRVGGGVRKENGRKYREGQVGGKQRTGEIERIRRTRWRQKMGDVPMRLRYHLQMYGEDRGADRDGYPQIKRWCFLATSQ